MSVLASAVQGIGSIITGITQGNMYHYQAEVAANNAKTARNNAAYAGAAGAANVEQQGLKDRAQESGITAGIAANNVDVNSGSPAAVGVSARELGAINQENTANKAAWNVYGYEVQQQSYNAEEQQYQSAASGAPIAGAINAIAPAANVATSVVGGPSNLPSWAQWMAGNSGSGGTGDGEFGGGNDIQGQAQDELSTMQEEDNLASGG